VTGRIALAAGAVLVALLLGALIYQIRPGVDDQGAGALPEPAQEGRATPPSLPVQDASPLPTPAEVAEARERVAAERPRPSHLSPELVTDHKLKAKPMRDARKAFQRGEYELALARAQDALAVAPDSSSARVLATLSACALGRKSAAQAHAAELDPMRIARVTGRCKAFGLDLEAENPASPSGVGARPTSTK